MNQHYFDVPFAFSGDVTAIPDPLQTGGTVSFTEGWNYNYQRDLATDPAALPIDRSTMNWLLLQITTALQALQQTGCPEFILASQNGGAAYSYAKGTVVNWSASGAAPFTKFVCIATGGNTNTPSLSDPTGATTGWQLVIDPIATSAQAAAGTDNASIMTPLLVAQQTALRALLAGSSAQVFNVGPAVAATQAPQAQQMLGRYLGTQIITANGTVNPGTYTVGALATTATKWRVRGVGGGGGSGGTPTTNASQCGVGTGGQSGAYCEFWMTAAATAVTVGAGGTAGAVGGTGGTGGTSTFGSLATCPGGVGGVAGITAPPFTQQTPGATGAPTGSAAFLIAMAGGLGISGHADTLTTNVYGGTGGSNPLGNGGPASMGAASQGGTGKGSGAGGGGILASTAGAVGTAGQPGVWIVDEYA